MATRWTWSAALAVSIGLGPTAKAQLPAAPMAVAPCAATAARFLADTLLRPDTRTAPTNVDIHLLFERQRIGPRGGTVMLHFLIDTAGLADTASLHLSGDTLASPKVRREAQRMLQRWRWVPARAGECPVPTWTAMELRLPD